MGSSVQSGRPAALRSESVELYIFPRLLSLVVYRCPDAHARVPLAGLSRVVERWYISCVTQVRDCSIVCSLLIIAHEELRT